MIARFKWYLFAITLLLTLPLLILSIYLFKKHNRYLRQKWCYYTLLSFGIKVEQIGEIDRDANLVVMNHNSLLDIMALEAIHSQNLCWVAKKEIRDYPIYGHILEAPNMIYIDREDKKELIRLLSEVKNRVESGRVISMFPEGTRNSDPKTLKPFKNGAKIIAEKFGYIVQPLAIKNSLSAMPFGEKKLYSTTISIKFMNSLTAKKGSDWFETIRSNIQYEIERG
jgi:1-acyl-sn-glycerol-3-phosphate acyltransferase